MRNRSYKSPRYAVFLCPCYFIFRSKYSPKYYVFKDIESLFEIIMHTQFNIIFNKLLTNTAVQCHWWGMQHAWNR